MNKNMRILVIILGVVVASMILLSIFTKIQNKRISNLKKTLDSLEYGKNDKLDDKYFNPDSSPAEYDSANGN